MARVDLKQVAAVGGGVITGVEMLQKAWTAINADGKVGEQAAALADRVRKAMAPRDPLVRVEEQLRVVQEQADELGAQEAETAERWRRMARQLGNKVPVVRAQDGKARRDGTKDLTDRTAALLAEVLQHGMEPLEPAAGKARRGLLRRGGGRS